MIKSKMNKVAAIATVAFMSGMSDAYAQGFQDITNNVTTSVSEFPSLISTVSYIAGAGLGAAGVFKLKQHVDNPGQVAMKDGLVRLGAGGGLLALPVVLQAMTTTIGDPSGADISYSNGLGSISSGS